MVDGHETTGTYLQHSSFDPFFIFGVCWPPALLAGQ
jgi:hypothetical protein